MGRESTPRMVLALADVLVWLGAAVLVAAGLLKLWSPLPAARFLRALHLPASRLAVRGGAVLEVTAGGAVLAVGGPAAMVAAGLLYAGFLAALAGHRLRTGERTVSCGCFGSSAAIPVLPHAAALAVVLGSTTATALAGREPLAAVLASLAAVEAALLLVLLVLALVTALGYSTAGSSPRATTEFTLTIERRGAR
jgi:hypothetical protein